MSLNRPLLRVISRRPFVCAECRKWLPIHVAQAQTRNISRNHLYKIKTSEGEWEARKADIRSGKITPILKLLEDRGYINQIVGNRDDLENLLIEERVGAYCGVDPTASSMHVGHMVPFMALGWMYIHGYSANFLLGAFTASVGDPTDRLTARPDQQAQQRRINILSMFEQLKRLATRMEQYAIRRGYAREWAWRRAVLNNASWWSTLTVSEYMQVLGSRMRIGPMLGRDSVKNRMENGDGMSYAEFSYPLLQGWDWWHQYKTGTQIQIGGADQFGNILAGAEAVKLIMKSDRNFLVKQAENRKGKEHLSTDPMGFTVPLLTTSSGEKFGKSAGNAIWIDPQLTSSFDLYQFFVRSADADVEQYLRLLTFLPLQDIHLIMEQHRGDESKRIAQHKLAYEFVELVHGLDAAQEAQKQHSQAFSTELTIEDIQQNLADQFAKQQKPLDRPDDLHPSLNKHASPLHLASSLETNIRLPHSLVVQQPLNRILWSAGLAASRSEGQRLINNRGVYIGGRKGKDANNAAMTDVINYVPATNSKWSEVEPLLLNKNILVLRTGKWKKKFVEIIPDEEYKALNLSCPGWEELGQPESELTKADLDGEAMYREQGVTKRELREQRQRARRSSKIGVFSQVKSARFKNEERDLV